MSNEVDELAAQLAALEAQANAGVRSNAGGANGAVDDDLSGVDLSDTTLTNILDPGWYVMKIGKATKKETKASTAADRKYLIELELVVSDGLEKGRKAWDRVMLYGAAKRRYVILVNALGLYNPTTRQTSVKNVGDLVGIELWVKLLIEPGNEVDVLDTDGQPTGEKKQLPPRNVPSAWDGFENISKFATPTQVANSEMQKLAETASDPFADSTTAVAAPETSTEDSASESSGVVTEQEGASDEVSSESESAVEEAVAETITEPVVEQTTEPLEVQETVTEETTTPEAPTPVAEEVIAPTVTETTEEVTAPFTEEAE